MPSRNTKRADDVIRFVECLTVPSGTGAGEAFRLRPFQERFVRDIYEPVDEQGRRIVRRAILSIGRKNGKTALIAALALAHLIGPEAIRNGEIYSAANDRDQAGIVFRFAKQIVEMDPELSNRLKVIPSTKTIVNYNNGTVYRALSSESGTKHGLSPSVVIFDELAQAKSRDLYDALDTAMGARSEPLFVTISTQSNDPEHILSKLIDDGLSSNDPTIACHLHAVPDDVEDIYDESVWYQANPALGDFRSLDDLRAVAERARRIPADEPRFRNLYLNQRVSPVSSFLSRPEWMACEGAAEIEAGEPIYLALDLSSTTDLTALVAVSAENGDRVKAWLWKPKEWLREHSRRDFGSGDLRYVQWAEQGYLETSHGRSIAPGVVANKLAELTSQYCVLGLAYDRWRINDLLRELDRVGLHAQEGEGSGLRLVPWGQGFRDMAPALDALELAVLNRTLEHPGNPVLTWCIANAVAVTDPAGNRKLDKDRARFRIDGAVALAMAVGLKSRDKKVFVFDVEALIA